MSQQMQDNQNDLSQQESTYEILVQESIHLPGKKHYRVTIENINGCRTFVIWELTNSYTNRRIIVLMNTHKKFVTYLHFFIEILRRIQLYIHDDNFDMHDTEAIYTEDDRSYKFSLYLEDENYYVKINQIENGDSVFITVDEASLEAIEKAIVTFHNKYRYFFHEVHPDSYWRIVETIYNPCCDLDITLGINSDSYSESDVSPLTTTNSDSDS